MLLWADGWKDIDVVYKLEPQCANLFFSSYRSTNSKCVAESLSSSLACNLDTGKNLQYRPIPFHDFEFEGLVLKHLLPVLPI